MIERAIKFESVFIEVKLRRRASNSAPAIRCNAKMRDKNARRRITSNQRICVATSSNKLLYCLVRFRSQGEATMSAIAEVLSTVSHIPRGSDLPTCPVCADSMVAAEASAYLADNIVSYLWTCDTCGYGFVTKHSLKRFVCN
jgi:hypothetical protein